MYVPDTQSLLTHMIMPGCLGLVYSKGVHPPTDSSKSSTTFYDTQQLLTLGPVPPTRTRTATRTATRTPTRTTSPQRRLQRRWEHKPRETPREPAGDKNNVVDSPVEDDVCGKHPGFLPARIPTTRKRLSVASSLLAADLLTDTL